MSGLPRLNILDRITSWLKGFWAGIKFAITGRRPVDSGSVDTTTENR